MVDSRAWLDRWDSDLAGGATLTSAGVSDVGRVREVNEDSLFIGPPLYVVADGMGGHARGDVASGLVVDGFRFLQGMSNPTVADLARAIAASRSQIAQLDVDGGPGSTVVAAAFVTQSELGYWLIAHEGDSRAYTWTPGQLTQVTRDHSVVQEMIDAGQIQHADARSHPERHVITRAVGAQIDSEPDFTLVPAEPGSRLLLCSDGLTGELSSHDIQEYLDTAGSARDAAEALLEAAIESGGRDNITVLVVDVALRMDPIDDTLGGIQDGTPRIHPEDTHPGRVTA